MRYGDIWGKWYKNISDISIYEICKFMKYKNIWNIRYKKIWDIKNFQI